MVAIFLHKLKYKLLYMDIFIQFYWLTLRKNQYIGLDFQRTAAVASDEILMLNDI